MDGYSPEITHAIFVGWPDAETFWRVSLRMLVATLLGGAVGWQRESEGKAAGLRTHMVVALAAATVVIVSIESGMNVDHLSRVVQGIVTGVGFIGAGAILKDQANRRVEGLTTAATILLTTAVGVTTALGWVWISVLIVVFALAVLVVAGRIDVDTKVSKST